MSKRKVSDIIASFFSAKGIRHAFVVSGGASLHLIHSIDSNKEIKYICCHHEQAAAMAADAYTRVTNKPGLAITSSGPGATNLITGICGCYYDSIPTFFITGQVSTFRMSQSTGVRQHGFQETPIVDMVSSITNYSKQILEPHTILFELEKAYYYAINGRPGPVLLDIPDNIQRAEVDMAQLDHFSFPQQAVTSLDELDLSDLIYSMNCAKRPIIIAGSGIHLAGCEKEFIDLVEFLEVPVALTWAAADILNSGNKYRIGTFGTHGSRYANFAVQNADFILAIGSRLDTKATGTPPDTFAREAVKAIVDISLDEINKFKNMNIEIRHKFCIDAGIFIKRLRGQCSPLQVYRWIEKIDDWKNRYSLSNEKHSRGSFVDPYYLFERLPSLTPNNARFWCDTGSAVAWMMQTFVPKNQQRVWHDYNNTAMGWALPASIGSCFSDNSFVNYCIVGDGSFMMNIQELQTIIHHGLNIKILCIDNNGYSMIKQTQEQWLDSNYLASSKEGGISMPNFNSVLSVFGFKTRECSSNEDLDDSLLWLMQSDSPSFLLVKIDQCCRVVPQVKFGKSFEFIYSMSSLGRI